MKRLKLLIVSFCLGLFMLNNSYAQEFNVDLNFDVGVPQGEFDRQLDRLGWGIGLMGGYRIQNTPLLVGLDIGFLNFGRDVREEPLSTTIPDLRVEVENSYNMFRADLLLRLIAPPSVIRPYVDGLFGLNYFFTETVIRERGSLSQEDKLRDTNFEDTTLNYGLGSGIYIRVYRNRQPVNSTQDFTPGSVYLNISGRYMFGREAEYLQEGSISRENGQVLYDVSRSETNLLYFKFGVVIQM